MVMVPRHGGGAAEELALLLILSLCSAGSSMTYEDAILDDMFGSSNSICTGSSSGTTEFNLEFTPSDNISHWAPINRPYEQDMFLAEMSHKDANANRSWTVRFGKGGNIYSFVGAYGESVPPQNHNLAPWNDEVWQLVSVNLGKNLAQTPYYIHQSGDYLKDNLDVPFPSPTLAKSCKGNQCTFVSWGQQAHVPTAWPSSAFYYTRYRDCGEGVLEVDWMIHNVEHLSGDNFNYLNVPWGGVRTSTLPTMLISDKGPTGYTDFLSIPSYASADVSQTLRDLDTTLGYTTFAQKPVKGLQSAFTMPCGDGSGKEIACPAVGAENQTLRLVRNGLCSLSSAEATMQFGLQLTTCVIEGTVVISSGCQFCLLLFTNPRNGFSMPVQGISSWSWKGNKLIFWTDVPIAQIDANWANGDSLLVSNIPGADPSKTLALTLVHGVNPEYVKDAPVYRLKGRMRFGTTSATRDYTVFTVNVFTTVRPGQTFAYRQYLISDVMEGLPGKASKWANQTAQRLHNVGSIAGRSIYLCSSDNRSFAATLGNCSNERSVKVCAGSSTPARGRRPLLAMECADLAYVGSDPYFFAPNPANSSGYLRPYVCAARPGHRPTWRLLGYFEEGTCAALASARYGAERELPWMLPGPFSIAACYETRSWSSLVSAIASRQATTGGLGRLMEPKKYEVWVCIREHVCPMAAGITAGPAAMCFVYDEDGRRFVPWDLAESLKMGDFSV